MLKVESTAMRCRRHPNEFTRSWTTGSLANSLASFQLSLLTDSKADSIGAALPDGHLADSLTSFRDFAVFPGQRSLLGSSLRERWATASYRRLDRPSSAATCSQKGRNGEMPFLDREMHDQGGVGAVGVDGEEGPIWASV